LFIGGFRRPDANRYIFGLAGVVDWNSIGKRRRRRGRRRGRGGRRGRRGRRRRRRRRRGRRRRGKKKRRKKKKKTKTNDAFIDIQAWFWANSTSNHAVTYIL
jgi:hypothetical protein